LSIVDNQTVVHIPTRTTISFYLYDEQPEATDTPTGIVSNVGMFSGSALRQFQTEAWKIMRNYRLAQSAKSRSQRSIGAISSNQ
jgi:hypothetical protein